MSNPFTLENKRIFVTGASSGIGKSIAIECSKMGGKMIISGRDVDKLRGTLELMNENGNEFIQADLTDPEQLDLMLSQLPNLDGVVLNAGIVKSIVTRNSEMDDIKELFKINSFAPIRIIQLLLQNKKINKDASIVFISSVSGVFCGAVGGSLYGATKASLQGFSKGLALEVANRGIRVNTVNPGMVETDIFNKTSLSREQFDEDVNRYPLKRYGKPKDIAYAVVYLLSEASNWVTGSSLLIDGGFTLV